MFDGSKMGYSNVPVNPLNVVFDIPVLWYLLRKNAWIKGLLIHNCYGSPISDQTNVGSGLLYSKRGQNKFISVALGGFFVRLDKKLHP